MLDLSCVKVKRLIAEKYKNGIDPGVEQALPPHPHWISCQRGVVCRHAPWHGSQEQLKYFRNNEAGADYLDTQISQ